MLRRRLLPPALLTSAVALVVAAAPPAVADTAPVSQSRGYFLAGLVQGADLAQAANLPTGSGTPLTGAVAVNTGGAAVTSTNPGGVGDLASLGVPLPAGGTLPVGAGLQFGVLNQYATANPDGSAASSSGAIADNGTIQAGDAAGGTAGDATLDLAQLGAAFTAALPAALQQLGDVKLTAGALAGRATQAAFDPAGTPGTQAGSYRIGSLVLTLQAPSLLTDAVQAVLTQVGAATTTLTQTLDTALQALAPAGSTAVDVQVTGLPDPATALDTLGTVTVDGLTVDFAAGTVTIDLAALVQAVTGRDVNSLPPNTDLLALLGDALAGTDFSTALADAVQAALQTAQDKLVTAIGAATATITVGGVALPVSGGTLLTLLGAGSTDALPGVADLTTALGTVTSGLSSAFGTLLGTLASGLSQLLGLTANQQVTADGAFTETALALSLLPGGFPSAGAAGTGGAAVLALDLGNASVGPGVAPTVATPLSVAPTPQSEVPTLANTGPFATLGSLAIGAWAVVAGAALLFAAGAVRRTRRPDVGLHRH